MSRASDDPVMLASSPFVCSCHSDGSRGPSTATATRPRILFVDDDATLLAGLRGMFQRDRTWNVVFARCAEDALDELGRAPVDVIVSDLCMPGIDGATLLRRVKTEWPHTMRILASGSARLDEVDAGVVDAFFEKPYDPAELRALLERRLGRRA